MLKWIIGIVIVIAAGVGIWWSGWLGDFGISMKKTTVAETPAPVQQQTQQPTNDLPTGTGDASDTAITQDAAAVDAQITALSSDSAGVDNSLNDKSVAQEY